MSRRLLLVGLQSTDTKIPYRTVKRKPACIAFLFRNSAANSFYHFRGIILDSREFYKSTSAETVEPARNCSRGDRLRCWRRNPYLIVAVICQLIDKRWNVSGLFNLKNGGEMLLSPFKRLIIINKKATVHASTRNTEGFRPPATSFVMRYPMPILLLYAQFRHP